MTSLNHRYRLLCPLDFPNPVFLSPVLFHPDQMPDRNPVLCLQKNFIQAQLFLELFVFCIMPGFIPESSSFDRSGSSADFVSASSSSAVTVSAVSISISISSGSIASSSSSSESNDSGNHLLSDHLLRQSRNHQIQAFGPHRNRQAQAGRIPVPEGEEMP